MTIRHVSLDVWNTLILPNPDFAKARKEYMAELLQVPVNVVSEQYTATKKYVDTMAETDGIALSTDQVFRHFIEKLFERKEAGRTLSHNFDTRGWCYDARSATEALFLRHPPIIRSTVKEALARLIDAGISLSIASNSNFISGKTVMGTFLREYLNVPFHFMVFSDIIGFAKPSYWFFNEVLHGCGRSKVFLNPPEVCHIGDNYVCDGLGAQKAGMGYAVISKPDDLLNVAKEIVQERQNGR